MIEKSKKMECNRLDYTPLSGKRGKGGLRRSPFAADRRDDGALFLEGSHGFVDDFAVETGEFGYFACVDGFAGFAHGFEYNIFFVHNCCI